jgi:hypothetical protein
MGKKKKKRPKVKPPEWRGNGAWPEELFPEEVIHEPRWRS